MFIEVYGGKLMSVVMCAHLIYFTYPPDCLFSSHVHFHCLPLRNYVERVEGSLMCMAHELRRWCIIEGQITESELSLSKDSVTVFFLCNETLLPLYKRQQTRTLKNKANAL